jgi:hypothetical protein
MAAFSTVSRPQFGGISPSGSSRARPMLSRGYAFRQFPNESTDVSEVCSGLFRGLGFSDAGCHQRCHPGCPVRATPRNWPSRRLYRAENAGADWESRGRSQVEPYEKYWVLTA